MPVTDAYNKADRLLEVQILLRQKPEGVRTAEIAEVLGVSQRTARRYLFELSENGRLPVYKEGWTWRLVQGARFDLLPVHLNLDEALALYLSARLLSAYSDKHNPHVVSALHKLASAMPQSVGEHIVRTAEAAAHRRQVLGRAPAGVAEIPESPNRGGNGKNIRYLFHRTLGGGVCLLCHRTRLFAGCHPDFQGRADRTDQIAGYTVRDPG